MPFKVTESKRIATYADMIEGLLCMRKHVKQAWTCEKIKEMLERDHGITDVSMADLELVNGELHKRGVVEDVGGS